MSLITPVILVGGSGKRLWPLSRESMPKQFVPLLGKQSTFQQTLQRVADGGLFGRPVIDRYAQNLIDFARQSPKALVVCCGVPLAPVSWRRKPARQT